MRGIIPQYKETRNLMALVINLDSIRQFIKKEVVKIRPKKFMYWVMWGLMMIR